MGTDRVPTEWGEKAILHTLFSPLMVKIQSSLEGEQDINSLNIDLIRCLTHKEIACESRPHLKQNP